MNVQAEFYPLHVSEEEKQKTHVWGVANVIADGVKIMNIRAVNYLKEDNTWGHFFSYPQIKIGEEYREAVRLSMVQKIEIEEAIQRVIKESILQETPEIRVASVSVIEEKEPLAAIASIQVNGIQIEHVRLFRKNGEYFLKLPQYQKNGEWKPLIQLENTQFTLPEIQHRLVRAYEDAVQKEREQKRIQDQKRKMSRGKTLC